MSWYGDMLRAGIKSDAAHIELTKPLVAYNHHYLLDISYDDKEDGTAEASIQITNAAGENVDEAMVVHMWISETELGAVHAITGITVDTGQTLTEVASDGELSVVSNSAGLIELTLDEDGAGTIFLNADIGGHVTSEEIEITT